MPAGQWKLAAALAVLLQAGCSPSREIEAVSVLGDIAAGAGASRLKKTTEPAVRETIRYTFEGVANAADVYRPGGSARAEAVTILVPGVVRLGKDDPRIVAFAQTLARARFLVFVPDLVNLRHLSVSSKDAAALSRVARYAAARTGVGTQGSVGMIAFSYAAGPALLAAMAEETRHSVRFVYTVGSYYSIEAVITYLTTGHFRTGSGQPWSRSAPSPYAVWVLTRSFASWLDDPADRRGLNAIADARLADPDADISDALARLGADGRAVYELLDNTDPESVARLVAGLPEPVLSELRALDLSRRGLTDLKARLVVIHGRDDRLIPYTESVALAAALERDRGRLFIVGSLKHVELRLSGVADGFRLWRAVRTLLEERDRMPPPSWNGKTQAVPE